MTSSACREYLEILRKNPPTEGLLKPEGFDVLQAEALRDLIIRVNELEELSNKKKRW